MKTATYTFLAIGVMAFVACRNANPVAVESQHESEYVSTPDEPQGVQSMNAYDYTDTLRYGGHTYLCRIQREASDSLPTVTDDFGTEFADNVFHLTIQRDGKQFFKRSFTKAAFSHLLSDEMLRRAVLDGMRADTTLAGLTFAVSVSQPQSDIYQLFLLTVDNAGDIAISRDTRAEVDM